MNGKKHFIKKIFQTMNWLWIQNGMKSSQKILNKFTENWFLFAKNLCIFCNDLWYVDYIGRTRYNCLYSPLTSRSDNWLRNPCCHEIFVSNLIDQLSLKVLLFALVLQFCWTRKLFDMTFDTLFGWYTKFLSFYFSGLPTNQKFE